MAIKSNLDTVDPSKITALTREFLLPSGGLVYREKHPDFPSTVVITPYGYDVDAILTTNLEYFVKLEMVAKKAVQNFPKDFDFHDLLISDLVMILTLARAATYGETWKFKSSCPACSAVENHSLKIPDNLPVKNWTQKSVEALRKDLTFKLERSQDVIVPRPSTLRDEIDLAATRAASRVSEAARLATGTGNEKVVRTARRIHSVNGGCPDSLEEAISYVKRLQGPDYVSMEKGMDEFECGIDFSFKIECAKCKRVFDHDMPMALSFFRGFP